MASSSRYYGLGFFDFGDPLGTDFSGQIEIDRFVFIDKQLYGLMSIWGNGVVSGWTVAAEEALTITVPPALARELDTTTQEFLIELLERGLRALKIERVLDRYAEGGMSLGAAAQQAGVSQSELARHAYARGMEPPFSTETLAEELS